MTIFTAWNDLKNAVAELTTEIRAWTRAMREQRNVIDVPPQPPPAEQIAAEPAQLTEERPAVGGNGTRRKGVRGHG